MNTNNPLYRLGAAFLKVPIDRIKPMTMNALLFTFLAALVCPTIAYGYYNPTTGRWLSRDPVGDKAFSETYVDYSRQQRRDQKENILSPAYAFVRNHSLNEFDVLGLYDVCCCDNEKIAEGLRILTGRWLHATRFLDEHGVQLDPDDVKGVSCITSANHILAFMAPVPPCFKCYIHRRSWNYNPLGDDENSIRCDVQRPYGSIFSYFFDWWYQKHEHFHAYKALESREYIGHGGHFGYDLDPPLGGWWEKNSPAPYDDCSTKSQVPPERYKFLQSLVKQ